MTRGHAAIDRSARDSAADRSGRGAEKPAPKHAVPDDRSSHSPDDRSGGRRRTAADPVPISGTAIIMMAMVCCSRRNRGK